MQKIDVINAFSVLFCSHNVFGTMFGDMDQARGKVETSFSLRLQKFKKLNMQFRNKSKLAVAVKIKIERPTCLT